MAKKPSLFNTAEKIVLLIVIFGICLVMGFESAGKLPCPWLKGVAGVLLAGIGLYTFWKVKQTNEE